MSVTDPGFRYDGARLAAAIAKAEEQARGPLLLMIGIPIFACVQRLLYGTDAWSIARPASFVALLMTWGIIRLRRIARDVVAEQGVRYRLGEGALERIDPGGAVLAIPFADLTPLTTGLVRWRCGGARGIIEVPALDAAADFLSRLAEAALGSGHPGELRLDVRIRKPGEVLRIFGPVAAVPAVILIGASLAHGPPTVASVPPLLILLVAVPGVLLACFGAATRFLHVTYRFSASGIDREESSVLHASRRHAGWPAVKELPGGMPAWPEDAMPTPTVVDPRATWTFLQGFHGGWLRHRVQQ